MRLIDRGRVFCQNVIGTPLSHNSTVLQQHRALAQTLQISGTPTFVMQDELLRGYLPYDQMKAILEEKRG